MTFIFDPSLADDEPVAPVARVAAPKQVNRVSSTVPGVTSVVRTVAPAGRGFLTKPSTKWTWGDLRDYVLFKIAERDGRTGPRSETVEMGIFKRFALEFGESAGPIAQFAFETCGGMWKGSPISIGRFKRDSDEYFAREILVKHLNQNAR